MEMRSRQAPAAARAVADRLHSAAIHLLRRLRVEDKALGLSGPRASALSVIVFRGPITMGALAEAEQVRRPTITRLVDGLERRGLVRRLNDPTDGRVQLVEASAARGATHAGCYAANRGGAAGAGACCGLDGAVPFGEFLTPGAVAKW